MNDQEFEIINRETKKQKTIDFVKLFLPVMIVSSLDVTMEGVHFPFIFLSFLGYFISSD